MKRLLLLLFLSTPVWCQCTIQAFAGSQPKSIAPSMLNSNFSSLNSCKGTVFTGTNPPGTVTGSVLGSIFVDSAHGLAYQCFGTGPCTAVASSNWVCLNCGGSPITGATTNCIVTAASAITLQTNTDCPTIDSSGKMTLNGTGVATLLLPPTTVSGLPTCNSGANGTHSSVTDANATTFLSTVAGGGSNNVPVYCNGTNWVIG